jgi:hypothetical protein
VIVVRIVSVRTSAEVSRVVIADDGAITYSGGGTARSAVSRVVAERSLSEAEAIGVLARDGWSNGYLMVALDQQ